MIEDSVSTALAQALKDELFGEKHPTRIRRSPGPRDTIPGHSLVAALRRGDRAGFEGSFADLIDLPINAVAIILYDSGHETLAIARYEERRVGQEGVSTCRIRCTRYS